MKNIAIIGASYLQLPLIERAKELGYITHVFAWAANDVGEKAADFFYPISITEKEEIADKCREIGVCGVCSIASDLAAITVNFVAAALESPGNSMEATWKSTNKTKMRRCFEENGDPSPKNAVVDMDTDLAHIAIPYPVVVKPTDRSGSRGICKVENANGLGRAVKAAIRESFEKKALIEEFVEGEEYSVEAISYHGKHHILTMTKKFTTGAPSFIETGHLETANIDSETFMKASKIVSHALDSLGISDSASHSEIKIAGDGAIKIIEIGGRMGGDCIGSDLVQYTTGIDYVRAVIQVACGTEPDLTPAASPRTAEVRYILTEEDRRMFMELLHDEPQRLIKIALYHPEAIGEARDSSGRAGCYIVRASATHTARTNDRVKRIAAAFKSGRAALYADERRCAA